MNKQDPAILRGLGVFPRGDKWVARPYVNGKQKWGGTHDTPGEAVAAAAKLKADADKYDADKIKVDALAELFTSQHVAMKSASTQKNYGRAIDKFLEEFAHRPAAKLGFTDVAPWAARHTQGTVGPVATMFNWACLPARVITVSPFTGVVPKPTEKKGPPTILTDEQVREIAHLSYEVHAGPMADVVAAWILFAAGTGMRPGEQGALDGRHIDPQARRVHVERALDPTNGTMKTPKNGKARTVALPSLAEEGLNLLPTPLPDQPLFSLTNGGRFGKASRNYWLDPVRRAAGRPGLIFYHLRHTCATRLIENQASSEAVAVQLGHSSIRHIERVYGKPRDEVMLDQVLAADSVATERHLAPSPVAIQSHVPPGAA